MRPDRRALLLSAAAAGLLGSQQTAHAQSASAGPGDAGLLRGLDDLAQQLLIRQPETATALGLDRDSREGLKGQLSDRSWNFVEGDHHFCANWLAALQTAPDAALSAPVRLHKAVVGYALELGADAARFRYGDNTLASVMGGTSTPYVVNQQDGAYATVPEFLDSQHAIANSDDADAYLERLHAMAQQLSQETDRVRDDAGRGVVAPDFILANALGQQRALLATPPEGSRLVTSLARRVREKGLDADFEARAGRMVAGEVYSALSRQADVLESLQVEAKSDAGVWRLPDGEAYYAWLLRAGTSTPLQAAEIHRLGLEQGREIDARMDGLLRSRGFAGGTVGERMAALGRDPQHLFPDTEAGRAGIIAYLNGRIAAVRPRLRRAFTLKMAAPVEVRAVPVEIQAGAAQGYMTPAALDGSRPAIYYINLKSTENWPRFTLPTLTFHEAAPGHAWQDAYLAEAGGMPLIRKLLSGFNAYVEGYALYAEQLADEIGLYEDDWAGRLGYLQGQKFRAARLVLDTGLHAERWTRAQAIDWAVVQTGRTREAMTSEIDRYCVIPGQACGYKIGHSEINRLRDGARARLGRGFDVRRFNDLLVTTGPVPLTVLGGVVEGYIAAEGRPPA